MINLAAKKAANLKEKITGLIGKEKPINLLIKTRFGIHTFGLKFPIDVLILDKNNRAVKIKKSLKPNSIFLWNPIHSTVLELPQGTIERLKIKLYDKINLNM